MYQFRKVNFASNSQLTTIGREAFANTGLIEIVIPDQVIHIQPYAFAWNHQLAFVFIPRSVTQIEYDAFSGGNESAILIAEISEKPSTWHQNWFGWQPKAVLWGYTCGYYH